MKFYIHVKNEDVRDIYGRITEIEISEEGKKFLESLTTDAKDYCRMGDTIFHDILEISEDGELGIGTYSQNSWTPGWTQIYVFPNAQDYANSCAETEEEFLEDAWELFQDWKAEHF